MENETTLETVEGIQRWAGAYNSPYSCTLLEGALLSLISVEAEQYKILRQIMDTLKNLQTKEKEKEK